MHVAPVTPTPARRKLSRRASEHLGVDGVFFCGQEQALEAAVEAYMEGCGDETPFAFDVYVAHSKHPAKAANGVGLAQMAGLFRHLIPAMPCGELLQSQLTRALSPVFSKHPSFKNKPTDTPQAPWPACKDSTAPRCFSHTQPPPPPNSRAMHAGAFHLMSESQQERGASGGAEAAAATMAIVIRVGLKHLRRLSHPAKWRAATKNLEPEAGDFVAPASRRAKRSGSSSSAYGSEAQSPLAAPGNPRCGGSGGGAGGGVA
jgi:hypothetical protein